VLVIGGGIVGAAIARDAAMRGYGVALVEQGDFGGGTSSRSSRLAHGGLRYLEHGDLKLVFEALRERAVLLRLAPHLVRPLPFIFPVHRGDRVGFWKLAAGMWLYDLLARSRNVPRHRMLGKRALLRAEPMLRERGLVGGARYFDAQLDDARLTVATIRDAERRGAACASRVRVAALETADGRTGGARLEDLETGETAVVHATVVVNATGPWADRIRQLEDPGARPILRLTKGSHVMVPRDRVGHHDAITLTSAIDGRVMFVLPWGDLSYIGTTDTDTDEPPESVRASLGDVHYLLRSANAMFPNARLGLEDVIATWSGLRPLVADPGADATAEVSREHVILRGPGGMLTIAGGKLTTHREMAAQLVDRVGRELHALDGRPAPPRAPTDREPLPGGEAAELGPFRRQALELGLDAASADHLLGHFGSETPALLNLIRGDRSLGARLEPGHPAVGATVVHAARREHARTVEDVLVRRIHLYYEVRDQGRAAAAETARLLGRELGWEAARVAAEAAAYETLVREAAVTDR
jgi:glycerol-3-phosphate dehydrogenase